jgi:2,3-bisphosphoglycerate-independent phosphoglycerate mutase
MDLGLIGRLKKPADTKIVLLLMDGLGGLPMKTGGLTELETAKTPNLDKLAKESICGLLETVGAGITPGSGPGHLGVFGYDPVKYQVGRGVLAALGVDFDLTHQDVAARGNFCTIDDQGKVTDRRAGRISTDTNKELCKILNTIKLPGVELFVQTVKEHRFLIVLRGEGLSGAIKDTDPQEVGKKPLPPKGTSPDAEKTVKILTEFVKQAAQKLADQHPANMVLLRGFAKFPDWPRVEDAYGLKACAIAVYPMYRGVAKLIGMQTVDAGTSIEEEFAALEKTWKDFDFFFMHVKTTDSAGEDGDFDRKVKIIEQVDSLLPKITALSPDVIVVTADHSTPSAMKMHSWHPVPVMLWSKYCRPDPVSRFAECECIAGGLGPRFPATDIMPLALANAMRLEKFGA